MNNDLPEQIAIDEAVDIALQYGAIDGDHHKQWVIDQMLRVLLGTRYEATIKEWCEDDCTSEWDVGIAP